MTSVNTNIAAMTALRNLQATNSSMEVTQNRVSTGLKINSAKDNAAYWAIATTLKSDNKSLATVKDALGLGSSTVDTAYQGLTKAKDVLDELKSKLTAATQDGVDRDTIQREIGQLQNQLKSIATSSVFSGENWLSVDTSAASYNSDKQVVASFARDASGSVSIGSISVDISRVSLFDASTEANTGGIIDAAVNLKGKDGRDLAIGGTDVTTGNLSKVGLDAAATNVTTGAATDVGDNNTSVATAAAALNAIASSAVVAGQDAQVDSAAEEALTGNFASATFDENDTLTLKFRIEDDTSDRTVTINKAAASATGIATAGTIASVDDLVLAVNEALGEASQTGVKAIKNADGKFALQRWDAVESEALVGKDHSVDIVSWAGEAKPLTAPATLSSETGATGAGSEAIKTLTVDTGASASGELTFDLDGTNTVAVTLDAAKTKEQIATLIKDAIDGNNTLRNLVTASVDGAVVTITYKANGEVTANPSLAIANGATNAAGTGGSTSNGADEVKASDETVLSAFEEVTLDGDDKITFSFADGSTTRNIVITKANVEAANTAAGNDDGAKIGSEEIFSEALKDALANNSDSAGFKDDYVLTYDDDTKKLKVEAKDATADQTIIISSTLGLTDTDSGSAKNTTLQMGLTKPDGGATLGTTEGPATAGTTAATLASTLAAGVAEGDTITVSYMMDGTAGSRTLTVGAGSFDAAAFETAWAAGTSVPSTSVPTVANDSGTLTFSSSTTGATSSFTLVDATVKSSAETGSRIKNLNVLADLTSSRAASVKSGELTWTGFDATDTVTLNLSADGQKLDPVTVAAGVSVDEFVANLNDNAAFSAKLTASKGDGGELILTSKTTGEASAASLTDVAFKTADGSAKNISGTGFGSVVSAGTASTAAFTSAVTLDDDDNLYFNIQIDQATAPTNVTIDKALVNKTLSTAANPVTNGTIATAADFKAVVDAALAKANVKGVTTSVNSSDQLVFTSVTVGANSKVAVSSVAASQGGDKISIENMDISAAGLAKVGATSTQDIKHVLAAYIDAVNTAITKVTSAASSLGSVASRIDLQKSFVNTLMDTIDKGVGNLVDADMSEESTRLQALQTKQQLGIQALSIANQSAQSILSLFRG